MRELRDFLFILEEKGLLKRVKAEVDWRYEVGAVTTKVLREKGPALLFEKVKGYETPLLTGAVGTWERFALAVGLDESSIDQPQPRLVEACIKRILHAIKNPVKPVTVSSGSCKENIARDEKVDVEKFPTPLWAPQDGGRYIGTLGCMIQKDPETGKRNVAIYRAQILGKDKLGIYTTQHGRIIIDKYARRGEPAPIAIVIGVSPQVLCAASTQVPYGYDEYDVAGGITEEPLSLVRCETVDLKMPIDSEIVIEGEISPNSGDWLEEGLFGEFTGFYGGVKMKRPTVEIKAITYRNNPILQGTIEGRPDYARESVNLRTAGQSAGTWYRLEQAGIPGFSKFYLPEMGCACFLGFISIDHHYYSGNGKQLIKAAQIFSHNACKYTVLVDDDTDIFDAEQVLLSMSTRVQPHRDIFITANDEVAVSLDPSIAPEDRPEPYTRQSRIGINATMHFKGFEFPKKVELRNEDEELVEKRWKDYGL